MKNILKSLVLIAAAAFTLSACSEKEVVDNPKNDNLVTLKFNIRNADEAYTKALLGTENGQNFLNWEDGDKIGSFSEGSFSSGSNTYQTSNNNAGNVSVSGDAFTLNVQAFYDGSITKIYSYFPYSSVAGKDKTTAKITIPASQHMTNLGFDADAMPMAGEPVDVDLSVSKDTDEPCGTINFSNLGSIIKFRVYTSGSTTETLTSVTYKATGIGGVFSIDLTGIDTSDESSLELTASDVVDEILTAYTTHPAIPSGKDNAIDVYMVVAPGSYSGSQVVVTTNEHTYTLDASGTKSFARSHIKPINVDITNGTQGDLPTPETWVKVTKSADFTAGTYYILRADGNYYVPNATGNPTCVSYTAGDDITAAMKWTATESGSGLIFESFSHAGYYLWTTNTGSANTISVAQNSNGASASRVWSFASVTANGKTYYTATAGASKYLVSYGVSNWRYYASSSINDSNIPAEFYKLEVPDNRKSVELTFAESVINRTTSDYSGFTGLVASATPNVTAITDNIEYAMTGDAIGTVNTSSGAVSLSGSVGTATVTASFAGDTEYKSASASYTINVTAPLKTYVKATSIESGTKYLIVGVKASDTYLATPIPSSKTYAYPAGYKVTDYVVDANTIEISGEEDYLFEISSSGTGYTIKQPDDRYVYASGNYNTLNVGTTQGVWAFEKQTNNSYKMTSEGTYIQFGQGDYTTFGRYSSDQTNASLPFLYVLNDGKEDAGISYSPASATITFGETLSQPTLTNTHGLSVSYTSNATGVATVAANGAINVVGSGTATITASWIEQEIAGVTYRADHATYVLTVNKATPIIAAFNNPTTSVAVGSSISTNTTTISPNSLAIVYTTSDSTVASIDAATGEVTGVANGTATISATFAGNANYNAAVPQTYTITVGTGGSGTHYYTKVTSTSDITDGDYLIVYETSSVAFDGGLSTLDSESNIIDVTIDSSNNRIEATSTTNAAKFTIDVTAGTILSASGKYIGVSSNSNGLKTTTDASTYTHTFEIDGDGNAVIKASFDSSTMSLRFNKASNQNRFRYYKNAGQEAIQLYKYN